MGCNASENVQPQGTKLRIYGDYFNQDTRSLLAICQMARASFDFVLVDTLEGKNKEKPYIDENPNKTVPMLSLGQTKVIGDSKSIFNYLVNTNAEVWQHFHHEDQAKKIKEILDYF